MLIHNICVFERHRYIQKILVVKVKKLDFVEKCRLEWYTYHIITIWQVDLDGQYYIFRNHEILSGT